MGRATREQWAKRVQRWRDSGLTAQEYATEIGVNVNTLQHWGWRLAKEAAEKKPGKRATRPRRSQSSVPLIEVVGAATQDGGASNGYEVVLAGGTVVRVPATFDDESLRRLLAIVEAR